jgi:tetratricopeptide (TPR) repeat protein
MWETMIVHGNGGIFQVERSLGVPIAVTPAGREEPQALFPQADLLKEADELMRAEKHAEASVALERILDLNPSHTHALHNLAAIAHGDGQHARAYELERRAVEIEPNFPTYSSALVAHADRVHAVARMLSTIENLRKFPAVHRFDDVGVSINLQMGRLDEAMRWRDRTKGSLRERLESEVSAAMVASARAASLIAEAATADRAGEAGKAATLLGQACEIHPLDAVLRANRGLALRRAGDLESAIGWLESTRSPFIPAIAASLQTLCLANAAFAAIDAGRLERAAELLDELSSDLDTYGGLAAADYPGVGLWVEETTIVEEPLHSAVDILARLEQGLGDRTPARIKSLIERYRQAAVELRGERVPSTAR